MSGFFEGYEEKWAKHESAGPVAWRSHHHGEPNADFAALCSTADSLRLQVKLAASDKVECEVGENGEEITWRRLERLTVGDISVDVQAAGSVRAAAAIALERLLNIA